MRYCSFHLWASKLRSFFVALFLLVLAIAPISAQTGNTIELGVTSEGIPTLVDANGRALYTFAHDEFGVSMCNGACAQVWPPLTIPAGEPTQGAGIPGAVGVTLREDGSIQVMYQGLPLYYYFEDVVPGDAKGQGLEDIWYAASPANVMLGGNQGFGNFLVGPGGLTLYVFLQDGEGVSNCFEECIHDWTPLLVNDPETVLVGQGIPGFVGVSQREDGGLQVTYNGAPLYFFYEDEVPGDMRGNGSKEVWYVAVPEEAEVEPLQVGIELVAEGFSAPIALIHMNDGSGRMLVADQAGLIYVVMPDGSILGQPFLDLRAQIVQLDPNYDERGLLGLVLHPNFVNDGRFYVFYSAPLRPEAPPTWNSSLVLAEFRVSPNDPNIADPVSQRNLLQIDKPQMNHNAGQIAFGPDGYLYIPIGDGGGAHDTDEGHTPSLGNGQDTSNLLGSILRIDVNSGDPYAIPADNPFIGDDGIPDEIFAYGLRNPFRISFDIRGDGSLYASDAGQNLFEEIDLITAGGNYGWNIKEGVHCFDPNNPTQPPAICATSGARGEPLINPIIEHDHRTGVVVVGGHVYRGSAIPELTGQYVFGDYARLSNVPSGVLMAALPSIDGTLWDWDPLEVVNSVNGGLGAYLLSFGQDPNGEIYVLTSGVSGPTGNTGKVWRLIPAQNVPEPAVTADVTNVFITATPFSATATPTITTTPAPTVAATQAPPTETTPVVTEVPTTEVPPPTEPTAEVTPGS